MRDWSPMLSEFVSAPGRRDLSDSVSAPGAMELLTTKEGPIAFTLPRQEPGSRSRVVVPAVAPPTATDKILVFYRNLAEIFLFMLVVALAGPWIIGFFAWYLNAVWSFMGYWK